MRGKFLPILLLIAVAALLLRLQGLSLRPMHGDEAIHADKFADLWQHGRYIYDPHDYHGPTLNYFTLPAAWLSGVSDYIDTSEATYRIVPVVFGAGLILLLALIADGLGKTATVVSAILLAISPAMVFYSRYYIQEMLLVFFTLAAIAGGWRYTRSGRFGWALFTGVAVGLMHATKETWVISAGAAGIPLVIIAIWRRVGGRRAASLERIRPGHILIAVGAAAGVSSTLLTGFFQNPHAVLDSLLTYGGYFSRGMAEAMHAHPWWQYLRWLFWYRYGRGPVYSELLIAGLAMIGIVAMLRQAGRTRADRNVRHSSGQGRQECLPHQEPESLPCGTGASPVRGFVAFLSLYTLILLLAYSAISYKTPWCMLSFLLGLILLAGTGATALLRAAPGRLAKAIVTVLLIVSAGQLAWQNYRINAVHYADDRFNPHVYAHPSPDLLKLVERVRQLHALSRGAEISVTTADVWPLPWYLRGMPVGYYSAPSPGAMTAPIVVLAAEDVGRFDRGFVVQHYGLRRGRLLVLAVQEELWNRWLEEYAR